MTQATWYPDLVSIIEIAEMLGVTPNNVRVWRHRGHMPPPHQDLAVGPVWRRSDIVEWAKATGRLPS